GLDVDAEPAQVVLHHVDVVAAPRGPIMAAAREIAGTVGLPDGWLSDRNSGKVPEHLDTDVVELSRWPNLTVNVLVPDLLLAMAVIGASECSVEGLRALAAAAGLDNSVEIEVLVAEIYPGRALKSGARTRLDELF
ncbi:MAG TPA: hypothetical protein PLV68_02335, partial [Ilumatobacteraceae bacterium]|nr:hypothetical protein [Ilumatobacteraceae bacterium]